MKNLSILIFCAFALILSFARPALAGQSGHAAHDSVLIGMHFTDNDGDKDAAIVGATKGDPINVFPGFKDYLKYMPEDVARMSYADFWLWWYDIERYKGDEKRLKVLDETVNECLARGIKPKIDLAQSTYWTMDKDWSKPQILTVAPNDVDDWIHTCTMLARRYQGQVVLWDLLGEANGRDYWPGRDMNYVAEIYCAGYNALKRVDPEVLVGISGATPGIGCPTMPDGKSNDREQMTRWVVENMTACKDHFDNIPMNYFADTGPNAPGQGGADPYGSLIAYYSVIRDCEDKLGMKDAEVGSGESSMQWAMDSYSLPVPPPTSMAGFDAATAPNSEMKQAWRMNESFGTFFTAGGNKWMQWGTEFAPGGGWPWRWGFRKYEDWWGVWPMHNKIGGTRVVYGYDGTDKAKPADLRPGWSSKQANPYHPIWEVFKFWAQAAPPASEAVRIPVEIRSTGPRVLWLGAFQQTLNQCVIVMQNDAQTSMSMKIDLAKTGWPDGTKVAVAMLSESIDYATGKHSVSKSGFSQGGGVIAGGALVISNPPIVGFHTMVLQPYQALDCRELTQSWLKAVETGVTPKGTIAVLNTGSRIWRKGDVTLAMYTPSHPEIAPVDNEIFGLNERCVSGQTTAFNVDMKGAKSPQNLTRFLRMRDGEGHWFGPMIAASVTVKEMSAPRKLVALREMGHIRLKWFAPLEGAGLKEYDLQRADGFDKPFASLKKIAASQTEYVDADVEKDRAYYYRAVSVFNDGRVSRPSMEDNAKAISRPRIYDAEFVEQNVPETVRRGDMTTITLKVKNTGLQAWKFGSKEIEFHLACTQIWGDQTERTFASKRDGIVQPGEVAVFEIPYCGPTTGRFENHWIMRIVVPGTSWAMFGSPLMVETEVKG